MSAKDLVRMANQIAINQAHLPDDQAADIVASHLTMFWAPSMRNELVAAVDAGEADLNEVALRAVRQLQPA
ncbi:MAG TPA: formate dehydrogenase subunit delta [Actinomycetes bacterium]|nr:formate dehydrogenase subunit delta [Actinomycetes bacterium]